MKDSRLGYIFLLVNVYWMYENIYLFYLYHYSGMLFSYMVPDWILISNTVLGVIGLVNAVRLIRGKANRKKAIALQVAIILIWVLLELYLL